MSLPLAAGQFKRPMSGDPHLSLAAWAERAAQGAELLVLPEMAASGYVFPTREAAYLRSEGARGPTYQVLSPIAKAHEIWIVAGYPERDGDRMFNSAAVINPAGELAFTYRKTLLYELDEHWAEPGDSGYRLFEASFGTFGVGICMDLNDDRFIDWMSTVTPDVLAFPTNWIYEEQGDIWAYWAWRMSGQNTTLVAANTYGVQGDTRFSGRSLILRNRVALAHAPELGHAILRADLSPTASVPPL
jgi:N-carbamoylputrescine amidase